MTVRRTRAGRIGTGRLGTGRMTSARSTKPSLLNRAYGTAATERGQRRRDGSGVGSALNPCSMLPIARMTGPLERLGAVCG